MLMLKMVMVASCFLRAIYLYSSTSSLCFISSLEHFIILILNTSGQKQSLLHHIHGDITLSRYSVKQGRVAANR